MSKKYNILLSAYACEPNRGSEPGVGWNWAIEIAKRGHEVWVITRTNNKTVIDSYFSIVNKPQNLNFIYYDLPTWLLKLKRAGFSVNLYYLFWQWGIVNCIKKQHLSINFDLIHHVTFGVFRHPSFLFKLNVPIIFGPVGGGEYTPKALKHIFPVKYRITESIRSFINHISYYNPILKLVYKKSTLILTKTDQTKACVPQKYDYKTLNYLEIGIKEVSLEALNHTDNVFRVLFVGRLIYWKGLDIALSSFAKFTSLSSKETEFIFVGEGPYKTRIERLAVKYGIKNKIRIIDWTPQDNLKAIYLNSNLLLFPSLHDSSGNVVLEALSFGLPVVCLDCGGPAAVLGEMFTELIVSTQNKNRETIENLLVDKIAMLANDSIKYNHYSQSAKQRAAEMTWDKTVSKFYEKLELAMDSKFHEQDTQIDHS